MSKEFIHVSVMPKETLEYLDPKEGGVYIDGTLGGGGHAKLVLEKIGPDGKLVGIDQDLEALAAAKERLKAYEKNTIFVHDNFRHLEGIVDRLDLGSVDGILLDLGVSSHQLLSPHRGFSFADLEKNIDAPLDMRMNQESPVSAQTVVNEYSQRELEDIFRKLGEEPFARSIAREIVRCRPLETVSDLLEAIKAGTPPSYRFNQPRTRWASKVFRAIRMEVNEELGVVEEVLEQALDVLKPGGRLVVITFHSLEDRIVKKKFRFWSEEIRPMLGFGNVEKKALVKLLTPKAVAPSPEEIKGNPPSQSAKIRAVEKL